jgi:CelD/BcsL family acetyltransferase involved in cellulose biosynthesis
MERAWQSGLREYDFMSGDEAYKSGWTDGERQIRYRALFPATPAGYAAYGALVAPRWRLKGSPAARAALQWWVRARGNPMSLLALPKPPQPAAE